MGSFNIQFEQCKIRIAVVCLAFALLCDIFLEYRCGLWVVAVQSVQDSLNVLGPLRRFVECCTHGRVVSVGLIGEYS